jgi:Tol biopolymer transport system component
VDLTKLTEHRGADWAGDRGAAWSPNGKRIAFVRGFDRPRGGPGVFVMRIDGTHLHRITKPVGRYGDFGPQWSPDGTHLAFKRLTESECNCRTADRAALFTIRVDGTHVRKLTPWRLDGGDEPDYSPDGRWILFESHQCICRPNNLWVVHPNGSDLHRITTNPGDEFVWLSSSFSPDGTMIVTSRRPGVGAAGNADVYVMNVDGSGLTDVTASDGYDSDPDWGPRKT